MNQKGGDAPGKFVTGDPDHQRQTQNFSKKKVTKSRSEKGAPDGFKPGTP